MAVATLYPLGFYLLVRAYEMGDGRYPQPILSVALAWLGAMVALGVAVRSQSAATRREAGEFLGLIGIAGAAAWVVSIVAPARAIGLPAGRGHPAAEPFPGLAMAIAGLILVAVPALPLVITTLAIPAQAEVMPASAGSPGGGLVPVITVSTELPALTLCA